jgi:hypothetical protein
MQILYLRRADPVRYVILVVGYSDSHCCRSGSVLIGKVFTDPVSASRSGTFDVIFHHRKNLGRIGSGSVSKWKVGSRSVRYQKTMPNHNPAK